MHDFTDALIAFSAYWQDVRTLFLGLIILLDWVLGIVAANRTDTFAWKRIGDTLRTNVLPKLLGTAGLYTLADATTGTTPGTFADTLLTGLIYAPAVIPLIASIRENGIEAFTKRGTGLILAENSIATLHVETAEGISPENIARRVVEVLERRGVLPRPATPVSPDDAVRLVTGSPPPAGDDAA